MSPAATLDRDDARNAVLGHADALFYERGVDAVTMGEIRDASVVSLRRLYSIFPSKSELVQAWLRDRHQRWMADFEHRVERRLRSGAAPADAVFAAVEDWMAETDFRGCAFINTHAEVRWLTEDHRDVIRDHKRELARYLDSLIPDGRAIAVVIDGAIVEASIFRSVEPIRSGHRAAIALTDPAMVATGDVEDGKSP